MVGVVGSNPIEPTNDIGVWYLCFECKYGKPAVQMWFNVVGSEKRPAAESSPALEHICVRREKAKTVMTPRTFTGTTRERR
ncbi:protein of unknown function [Pararobbsia alpina]